jgi:hypothetical protein
MLRVRMAALASRTTVRPQGLQTKAPIMPPGGDLHYLEYLQLVVNRDDCGGSATSRLEQAET